MSTNIVTDAQIAAAEKDLQEAIEFLAKLQTLPASRTSGGLAWASASGRVEHCATTLGRLREQQQKQQQAAADRAEREKKAGKRYAATEKALRARRDQLSAVLVSAQDALVALVEATYDYDGFVRDTAAELATSGLTLDGDEYSGGDPRANIVRVGGEWWPQVHPEIIVRYAVARVARARFRQGTALNLIDGDVVPGIREHPLHSTLPGVPKPEQVEVAPPSVRVRAAEHQGPPVGFRSEYERERAERDAAVKWVRGVADPNAGKYRAPKQAKQEPDNPVTWVAGRA